MKSFYVVLVLMSFLVGCGNNSGQNNETKFQGTVEANDYLSKGFEALKQSDIQKAVRNFDLAIKQNPKDVKNYLVLGEVYLRLKNFTGAEDTFTAATKVAPNNPDAYYYLALSRGPQESKKELAIEAAKKSAELYMQDKNEESFKRSLILLRGLEGSDNSATMAK